MYRTLYDIAGIAMVGWLLLILLPTWRVTRRVAAVIGQPPLAPTVALAASIIGLIVWAAAAGYAVALRLMRLPAVAQAHGIQSR